jgi:hypothetical protein
MAGPALDALGTHLRRDPVLMTVRDLGPEPFQRAELPHLGTPVLGDEVGRDAVQPRLGALPRQIELLPPPERGVKGLGGDVVGGVHPEPPCHVPVDPVKVGIKDRAEPLRFLPGPLDRQRVAVQGWRGVGWRGRGDFLHWRFHP